MPPSMPSTSRCRRAVIRDDETTTPRWRWMGWSPTLMFDAKKNLGEVWKLEWYAGTMCAARVPRRRGEAIGFRWMPRHWAGFQSPTTVVMLRRTTAEARRHCHLLTADFRNQYYGLVGAVSDSAVGPPLITSGLIEPNECWWGRRPVRFAKRGFAASPPMCRRCRLRCSGGRACGWCPLIRRQSGRRCITRRSSTRNGVASSSVPGSPATTDRLDEVAAVLHSDAAKGLRGARRFWQWAERAVAVWLTSAAAGVVIPRSSLPWPRLPSAPVDEGASSSMPALRPTARRRPSAGAR